jgi:SAM-dependent methyltransferase
MDPSDIKHIASYHWEGDGATLDDWDRADDELEFILKRMLIYRSVEDIDLADKDTINVCGGAGIEAEILLKQGSKSVVLLDATELRLAIARERARRDHLNGLECVKGLAEALPFCDGTFDLGYIHNALHVLPDYAKGIGELCRVSKEVVIVAIMNPLLTRLLNVFGLFTKLSGLPPIRMNGKNVADLLEGAGLKPTITYFFIPPINIYNRYIVRCCLFALKTINSLVNRSKRLGSLFGNIAIISGLKQ